jgi:predicted transcriptional regulator
MKALTLKLPETLDHRLTEFARARGAGSKSEVVRLAIEAYLDAAPRSSQSSAAVMARKWAGRVTGPSDLSHHPSHMADFGR